MNRIVVIWSLSLLLGSTFLESKVNARSPQLNSSLAENPRAYPISVGRITKDWLGMVNSSENPGTIASHRRSKRTSQNLEATSSPMFSKSQQLTNLTRAIATWSKEAELYRDRGQTAQEIETLLKIARGYISLGQFQAAQIELNRIVALAPASPEKLALTQKRLGDVHSGLGDYESAISAYKASLETQISLPTLNSLVQVLQSRRQNYLTQSQNTRSDRDLSKYRALARRDRASALKYARRALVVSQKLTHPSAVRALIQWADLQQHGGSIRSRTLTVSRHQNNSSQDSVRNLSNSGKPGLSAKQLEQGRSILESLPPSRSAAYLMIDWAKVDSNNQVSWLHRASNIARTINDSRAFSYIFLELAYFYQENRDLELTIDYAKRAIVAAESSNQYDSLFRAQRLSGQVYQKIDRKDKATNAYRSAVASIDLMVQDLGLADARRIVEFNQEIEPIYRETLDLLLDAPSGSANLDEALSVFDKLRLAQLQRYFGDNCFEIARTDLFEPTGSTKNNIALINSIILKDRVVFILQLPDGRTIKSEAQIPKTELVSFAEQWYRELTMEYTWEFRTKSRWFYDLIVKPFAAELEAIDPEALVFIHDGILRNLPMAALLDDEQFLAEKWASVSSIGLNYTSTSSKPKSQSTIAFGLEDFPTGWEKLPGVREEIDSIQNIVGGKKFFGKKFTVNNLMQQLDRQEYSIVHLATHGYFGGTAETSFVLAYDQKISALELEDILGQSKQIPNLLVLSACETAVGSELAILGLAGVGARSGVATTLGSFWQVGDESQSETIKAFYSQLENRDKSKAMSTANYALSLQQVQIEQIRALVHPQQWAALNLIGYW